MIDTNAKFNLSLLSQTRNHPRGTNKSFANTLHSPGGDLKVKINLRNQPNALPQGPTAMSRIVSEQSSAQKVTIAERIQEVKAH